MTITGYKIVYDIIEDEKKFSSEIQAYDLPEYVREKIDQYFNYIEEENKEEWWTWKDILIIKNQS